MQHTSLPCKRRQRTKQRQVVRWASRQTRQGELHMRSAQRSDFTLQSVSLRWAVAALLPLAAAAMPHRALAAASEATPVQGEELQEVVVSAEKRSETVQEAPLSITAISGADLSAKSLNTVEDVVQQVPGVAIRTAG